VLFLSHSDNPVERPKRLSPLKENKDAFASVLIRLTSNAFLQAHAFRKRNFNLYYRYKSKCPKRQFHCHTSNNAH